MELGAEVSLLLLAAGIGAVLARQFGQPAILGEILLGVMIGPSIFGLVAYDETVHLFAEMGAIVLLFLIGLECNYREIYTPKNSLVALLGVVVPFVAGWGLAWLFGYKTIEGLFIGVALTATSIAITAQVLREKGLLQSSIAKTVLGAAVIDDVLGLIALSAVTGAGEGASWGLIGVHALVAIAFVLGALALIKPINKVMDRIEQYASKKEHRELPLFAALIAAFAYAGLASAIGLSSIVGAFLAGVTLEISPTKTFLTGITYLETFFGAIFFLALGILTELGALKGTLLFSILLILVAVLTKVIACALPARAVGHTWKESWAIGWGMVPRGEVAMIVGVIGVTMGVLGQAAYGAIVLMAFVTTVIVPPILTRILPRSS